MDKPVDLDAVRALEAKLDGVLEAYPELLEANPEREQALQAWLEGLDEEGVDNGV